MVGKNAGISEKDVLILPVDITKMELHQQHFNKVIEHFGQLDVLINNAGRSQRAHWLDIEIELDRDMFEGNVFGLLNLSRVVMPHFLAKKRGHIAVTSSVCGKVGAPFSATYNATKHALHVSTAQLFFLHSSTVTLWWCRAISKLQELNLLPKVFPSLCYALAPFSRIF